MIFYAYPEFRYIKKRHSIYTPKTDKLRSIREHYEVQAPTICGEHIVLANMINDLVEDPEIKNLLLIKVDAVYDMGKRMGDKLAWYYRRDHDDENWRDGY